MELRYLQDLWNDAETAGMDEPELLRYRSNLLGRDLRLTNFGGGNTSAKLPMTDPVTGETVTVLWVKGSGGDLGTIKRDGFATLYMDRLNAMKSQYRGVEFEDEMVDRYPLCTFGNNPRAASIDTPLHGFLPFPHVDHLHPDWAISLAACANGPAQLERLHRETGIKLIWLPWKRPGFELGLWLQRAAEENPDADGILLGSHGLFTWGQTGRESYLNTLRVLDGIGSYVIPRIEAKGDRLFGGQNFTPRADRHLLATAIMPSLRGAVGNAIGHFTDSDEVQRFINSDQAKALAWQGTSCPDHFVRTKVRPLFVEWDVDKGDVRELLASAQRGMAEYRVDYARYYEENKLPDSPAMRSANPTVILVPGVGMFSFGRNKSEARITGEFYVNAIHVMEGATAMADAQSRDLTLLEPYIQQFTPKVQRPSVTDNYVALPPNEAFGIEYWQLEEAKLKRMPAEKELSRKIAVIIGSSPGIGQTVAERLAKEGAHVVVADIREGLAQETADAVKKAYGKEVAAATVVDATDRASVQQMLESVVQTYGGVDIVVCIAAVFYPPDTTGHITEEQWRRTFDVNLLGAMLPADEAQKIMAAQGTEGSIILISSANGVVAKKGSWAYDTSKAGLNHLVRELAIEFAPKVRVNGVAPASVVEGSLQFPRERVMSSLAKYNIPFDESETTEALRDKLSGFYSERTLLKKKVTPAGVAEAVFLLASDRTALTTGQIFAVDAGLPEAFLR
ncbi:MAG TPA: bifunctional rhamnulose-1-phosphate aldolase/short-chain dehydrogenase [Chthonomonadaceae bacterium]|nr:bifunctional rhamnulose-1-phosphate aldolase/short-chain dehydrogenase [Chthonomonadaceae bacterium]